MKVKIGKFPKTANRKINVQIEKFDTWSLDHSLAHIIYPGLLQLKASKHGIPSTVVDKVGGEDYIAQDSFDFYKDTHQETWDIAATKWDDILDHMIWAFAQILDDSWEDQYHHGKAEYDWKQTDRLYPNPVTGVMEPTYQMVDKNPTEHWTDYVGIEKHNERIQEGLDLFGKHYRNLWD